MRYVHVIAAAALVIPAAGFAQVSGGTTGGMAGGGMSGQTTTMPGQMPGQTAPCPPDHHGSARHHDHDARNHDSLDHAWQEP